MTRIKTLWINPAAARSAAGESIALPGGIAEIMTGPGLDFEAVTFDGNDRAYRLVPGQLARLRASGAARPLITPRQFFASSSVTHCP
ncbi:MAG: hypothetical protein FJX52_00710 [Alphaproteobacteria bacterium]|nr:hypothetical protein [Alphaproteobacteria bacterium]